MMEQDRKEYLDKDESEKMCSSKIGEAGEMCSPADTDTCGNMRSLSEDKCNARSLNLETQLSTIGEHRVLRQSGNSELLRLAPP